MPLLAATGYGGNLNAITAFMGTSTMVDYRKDVYRHLGTHCGEELGKKHNVMDLIGWSLFPHLVSMLVVHSHPVRKRSSITVTWRRSMKSIMFLLVWPFLRPDNEVE